MPSRGGIRSNSPQFCVNLGPEWLLPLFDVTRHITFDVCNSRAIHVRISCSLCTMWKSADRNISTVLGSTGSIIYGAGGRGMGVSKNLFWYKKLGYNMFKYIDLSKDFTLKYYLQG